MRTRIRHLYVTILLGLGFGAPCFAQKFKIYTDLRTLTPSVATHALRMLNIQHIEVRIVGDDKDVNYGWGPPGSAVENMKYGSHIRYDYQGEYDGDWSDFARIATELESAMGQYTFMKKNCRLFVEKFIEKLGIKPAVPVSSDSWRQLRAGTLGLATGGLVGVAIATHKPKDCVIQ